MVGEASEVIGRVARRLAAGQGPLTPKEGEEFTRALSDLTGRVERAVETLRQLVELVKPQAEAKDIPLTPRELEVLSHLAEGCSNTEIATKCWISENTVKFHLKNLFRKLEVQDRGQAMMMARAIRRRVEYTRERP
jgi:LuxR family transcriptional regulator, maltose regulon positive regulatory protein